MSARLIKIGLIIGFVHVVVLSLVWIGFPVPLSKPGADFVYVGALVSQGNGKVTASTKGMGMKQVEFDQFDAPTYGPWLKLRAVSKPKR